MNTLTKFVLALLLGFAAQGAFATESGADGAAQQQGATSQALQKSMDPNVWIKLMNSMMSGELQGKPMITACVECHDGDDIARYQKQYGSMMHAMGPMMQMANPQFYGGAASGMMAPMTGMMAAPMGMINPMTGMMTAPMGMMAPMMMAPMGMMNPWGMGAMPGMGGMPSMPMMPGMPGMGGMPMMPGMPGMGAMPGIPGMPGMGGMPMMPGAGGMPMMPGAGGMPMMPGAPGAGSAPAPMDPQQYEKFYRQWTEMMSKMAPPAAPGAAESQ